MSLKIIEKLLSEASTQSVQLLADSYLEMIHEMVQSSNNEFQILAANSVSLVFLLLFLILLLLFLLLFLLLLLILLLLLFLFLILLLLTSCCCPVRCVHRERGGKSTIPQTI